MKVLFVSNDLIGGNIACLLQKEGHDVKLFIEAKDRRNNLEGFVKKTNNWKKELKWVGKDGLIVFDDVGYGQDQDNLRKKGYIVFGGSEEGERLERDRAYGQQIFREYGLKTVTLKDFSNPHEALRFAKKNPGQWVIKQNDHHYAKVSSYVGELSNGKDVIDMLEHFSNHSILKRQKISLQKKIIGIEIGIGRYFNGYNWVGPIEYNIEHPRLFPGDIGPITSEMGTLAWYSENESARLFKEVLEKLKPFLRLANFKGDFEINCIVNENGAFPLEATTRMGSPIVHLQSELNKSPWGEFLFSVASGSNYNLKWKKGYGIVVLGAVPPFPFEYKKRSLFEGVRIYFDKCSKKDMAHIHFEEVSRKEGNYYISDSRGYTLYVTEVDKDISSAQKKVYQILKKICIPKLFYRNDIGSSFIKNKKKLLQWGFL